MSLQACADLLHRGDPDRFAAVMAAPLAAREKLLPIFAFNLEVARAPWVASEPMIAEMRLQWWRDALDEIAKGGPVRRHEVTTPLADAITAEMAARLDGLVAARRWDCYKDAFEDAGHFAEYLNETSGTLLWVAAQALGAVEAEAAVRDAGFAIGLAKWFEAIPELETRGRKPLVDGRPEAVALLASQALDRLASARGKVPSTAIPALRTGWQTAAILKQAKSDPTAVAEGRLGTSGFAKRAGLLTKALTNRW